MAMRGEGMGLWKLPEGWDWKRLEETLWMRSGSLDPQKYPDEDFELYSMPAYDAGMGPENLTGRAIGSSKNIVQPSDCLLSKLNPRIPRVWIVEPNRQQRQLCSTDFVVLVDRNRPDGEPWFESAFLRYMLLSPGFQVQIRHEVQGATGSRQRLSRDNINAAQLPVPPLAEQRRIVARIEDLFARIVEARRLRIAANSDAERLLNAAIEHVLDEVYAQSPKILSLGDFAIAFNGRASGSGESDIRVFKTKHVYPFDLRQTEPSYMKPEQVTKCPPDRYLRTDDVLICNIARGTLGRVCHVDVAQEKWTVDTQIMILRTDGRCLGKWLFYYLYSRRGQVEILAREKGIAFADKRGQTHLYPREMRTVPVPLPPLGEQRHIVEYLDSVQVQVAELKRLQAESAAELERLEQSILARAFRGEL
jgi:type I restriction enzyme S subunit